MGIRDISPLEDCTSENDNECDDIDVHIRLDDGRAFSLLVATPNNIFWRMDNAGIDDYLGAPPLFVKLLNRDCIQRAIQALVAEVAVVGSKFTELSRRLLWTSRGPSV
jgi:hypothetical protein